MTSRTRQASPEALDHFGVTMKRSGARLDGTLSANAGKVSMVPRKLDNYGVLDELSAAYPAAAADCIRAVQQLTEVLDDLVTAAHRSAARFREADQPVQGQG